MAAETQTEPRTQTEPWFADGLRFTCTRCGNCCTGPSGFVWVTEEEITAIAAYRGEPREQVAGLCTRPAQGRRSLRERLNGDCVFFDPARGCTIYPVRPTQCRTWPFWESNLRTPADWDRTRRECPGAGQGELIPAEEITRRLQLIRM